MNETTLVIGAGSWGTALSMVLARNNAVSLLWGRDEAHLKIMRETRSNARYLAGIIFPKQLEVISDLIEGLARAQLVVIAVPSQAFMEILEVISPHLTSSHALVWACKGIALGENPFFHETVALKFKGPIGLIAGPSFAREVALAQPTALVMASPSLDMALKLAQFFQNPQFRLYLSTDLLGVQLGGVLKNIYAVGAGLCDGLKLGANARAALLTRGLKEMIRLGTRLGARAETFLGLSGCGDLILSCTDDQSRNRRFGLLLGQGRSQDEALAEVGQVVEANKNINQIYELSSKYQVEMPIVEQIYHILNSQNSPLTAVKTLFARPLQEE